MNSKTALASAAGLFAALAAIPAFAGTLSYSGYSVTNDQNVVINDTALGIVNESGGSGQIVLQTPGGQVATWCVDIADVLQGSGTYTLGAPPPPAAPSLSMAQISQIGGLMAYGDANIGTGFDYSSATQIAIWTIEYEGTGFSVTGGATSLANTLVTEAENGTIPGYSNWTTLSSLNDDGVATNQGLGMVPEPATWAMMLIGVGALGAVVRGRKRQAVMSA